MTSSPRLHKQLPLPPSTTEIRRLPGSGAVVERKGRVAYVGQKAWIRNCTLRENVVFGLPFDEAVYQVRACMLALFACVLAGEKESPCYPIIHPIQSNCNPDHHHHHITHSARWRRVRWGGTWSCWRRAT